MRLYLLKTVVLACVLMLFTADRLEAQAPPEWTVNSADYEHFMTVTSELFINDTAVGDPHTVLAAFIADECRGVATPTTINDEKIYFLMIYGNSEGAEITFRIFYAPADTILTVPVMMEFEAGAVYGSPDEPYFLETTLLGIDHTWDRPALVDQFQLAQNYPNPFNPSTTIVYELPVEAQVMLVIYTLQGQWIRTLVDARQSPGLRYVNWDGRDARGQPVSTGIYPYRIMTPGYSATERMTLLR